MYILINKNTNRIVHTSEKKPIKYTINLILAEVDTLPEKYDYLIAENIREVTKTWTEIQEDYDDNGEIVAKEVERSMTYLTCDLVVNFRPEPTNEQVETLKQKRYGKLVARLIREKYSQDEVEAIINNYLFDPQDETYRLEFSELQKYREECKIKAHNEIYAEWFI